MSRRGLPAVLALLVLALAAAGCASGDGTEEEAASTPEGTEAAQEATATPEQQGEDTLRILAGAAGEGAQGDLGVFAFYPSTVQVHPGGTLRFENGSGAIPVPHTVTRGAAADIGAAIPPPVAPPVGQVPAVWGLCVSQEPVAPDQTACPGGDAAFPPEGEELEMPAFAGQAFYNSGIFDAGQTVAVPISADAEPDTYSFVCYLHPGTMELTVEVLPSEETLQTQEDLDTAAEEAIAADIEEGVAALSAAEAAERPPATVQAGAEQGAAVITRFFPSEISVPAGTTVTWVNEGNDPHVVALGAEVEPHGPENFAPPTIPPGGDYTEGDAISGVFGNPPFPATTYALRFPSPGRYVYVCPIHPGMAGVVDVT